MLLVLLLQWPRRRSTAPELQGSKSLQDSGDMHGATFSEGFLKVDLEGTDFSQGDLRLGVQRHQLQDSNFSGADLRDVVAFSAV